MVRPPLLLIYHTAFSSLAGVSFAQRGGRPHGYEPPPSAPKPYGLPHYPGEDNPPTGITPLQRQSPFNDNTVSEEKGVDLEKLAEQIGELLKSLTKLADSDTSTSSSPDAAPTTTSSDNDDSGSAAAATTSTSDEGDSSSSSTITAAPSLAGDPTLGCSVYQAYTALCVLDDDGDVNPLNLPGYGEGTISLDATQRSSRSLSSSTSCLCYSSTVYVPDVFDAAVTACAAYLSSSSGDSAAAASTATTTSSLDPDMSSAAAAAAAYWPTHYCAEFAIHLDTPGTFGGFKATPTPTAAVTTTDASSSVAAAPSIGRKGAEKWAVVGAGALIAAAAVL